MADVDLSQFVTPRDNRELPAPTPRTIPEGQVDLAQFLPEAPTGGRPSDIDLKPFISQRELDGNSLADEFVAGVGGGVDSLQGSLFGVAALAGRETGIKVLEDFGLRGAQKNFEEAADSGRESGSFSQIESAGGFVKWAAASLGEALPSIALAIGGGGVGGILAKKAIETTIKRTLVQRIKKQLLKNPGFSVDEAAAAAGRVVRSRGAERRLLQALSKGKTEAELAQAAFVRGGLTGGSGAAGAPIAGQSELELREAGIDPGLTPLLVGVLGGAMEALPALRLIDKAFPGLDQVVAKTFIKDFAISTGTQAALEGTTEAAQEIIQLAAMAYHDPSFNLTEPSNATRVIDAFAAGALVGTVTGGGATAIGELTGNRARPEPKRVNKPEITPWAIDEGADETLPEGFEPADNTVYQEIRDRVMGAITPLIEPAINSLRDTAQAGFDALDSDLGGGMNTEATKLSEVIKDAHNKFIAEHKGELDQLRKYVNTSAAAIMERAKAVLDPEVRAEFIEGQLDAVKESVQTFTQKIRDAAAARDQRTEAEVDNMDLDDELLDAIPTVAVDIEGKVIPPEGPAPGDIEAAPAIAFGKFEKTAEIGVSGAEELQGYDSREQADKALEQTIRPRFPTATDEDFQIVEQPDGTFTVETQNPELQEDHQFNQTIRRAIDSAERTEKTAENEARKFRIPARVFADKKTGFKFTSPTLHIPTLAFAGRQIDPDAQTLKDSFLAFTGKMLERGFLDNESFVALEEKFDTLFPDSRTQDIEEFAPVTSFPTEGAATASMISVLNSLKDSGVEVPFDTIDTIQNADGTFSFGIVDGRKFTEMVNSDQQDTLAALRDARRQEKLTAAAQRGLAPETQVEVAEGEEGIEGPDTRIPTTETDKIQAERAKKLSPEAKKLSDGKRRILKRLARKSKVKVLIGLDFDGDGSLTKALAGLGRWLQNTLGLENEIVIIDDIGLSNLIETGTVTDPIFQETLNNPEIHARNIRLFDTSYVYLSPRVLSDPSLTVTALGHEFGHHLYSVAWDALTPAAQTRLREASNATTDEEFNEWMADQLSAWITTKRGPKNAVEAFFHKVGAQVRRLYDFLAGRKGRFQLNETFGAFADAVSDRARTAESPGANPLRDENMRIWFANEGVTMYKWWGKLPKADAMTLPTQPNVRSEEMQKMIDQISERYPGLVKRTALLRNWVFTAYKLAAAPATSTVRNIGKRVPIANKLVSIFGRENHGEAKKSSNYHQRIYLFKGQFLDGDASLRSIIEGMTEDEKSALVKSLRAKEGDRNATFTKKEQQVRDLFDAMHAYARANGLPVRQVTNYFPRQLSRELLITNKDKILNHLQDGVGMPLAKARQFYNSLVSHEAQDGRATGDAIETPGFRNMNSRTMDDKFFDQFMDDNLDGIVSNYVNSLVKRAEFNRVLGQNLAPVENKTSQQLIRQGLWDPKAKLNKMIKQARKEKATDDEIKTLEKYVDANLGQLGRDDISPGLRKAMAAFIAYQNTRVLLFTVFASLPDLVGPAIRTGNMREAFVSVKKNITALAKNDSDIAEMARAFGIISSEANNHIMTEYVDNNYMPPALRKWNDGFFKWTGLNWYTDFTRKMALAVGIDYIQNQAEKVGNAKTEKARFKAEAALAELGLTSELVETWQGAGKPTFNSVAHDSNDSMQVKIAEALVQFVDESIMRPNASQRPIMASHPAAMLVFHLKGYLYAVHEVVLKRIAFNVADADGPSQAMAALIAPAIAMMMLTAVGLELREIIQYAGSGRKPPTDRMDGWEYTWELFERAGLPGITQLGFDFQGASDRGMSQVAGISGPTASQIGEFLSRPYTQTIPKAIPIVSQIPALRNAVRTVL